jgi:transcriptional regulator with XRE-family HTH domain
VEALRAFGIAVLRAREYHGWTQEALASRLGLQRQVIIRLEKGGEVSPSAFVLTRIARECGISVDEVWSL